jgi:hypothetical protein
MLKSLENKIHFLCLVVERNAPPCGKGWGRVYIIGFPRIKAKSK